MPLGFESTYEAHESEECFVLVSERIPSPADARLLTLALFCISLALAAIQLAQLLLSCAIELIPPRVRSLMS